MLDPNEALLKGTPTKWKIAIAVIITLFLGAIANGIWEVVFRPGLSMAGGFISRVWSTADDAIFVLAAGDPRSLPGMLFFALIPTLPGLAFLRSSASARWRFSASRAMATR